MLQHDVPDVGQVEGREIVTQILRQALAADQIDQARRQSRDCRPGALDRLGDATGVPAVAQRPKVGDVVLDRAVNLAQVAQQVGIVFEVGKLAAEGLLDMVLEREHVGDVAVDCFVPVQCHDNLQG